MIAIDLEANIHSRDDEAVRLANQNGHLDAVDYLVSQDSPLAFRNLF